MLDFLQPSSHAVLFTIHKLADGIEWRGGQVARLRLVGKIISIELTNEMSERLGDFLGMLISVTRVLPLRPGQRFIGHPVLRELFPHMRHVGSEMNVAPVLAAIDIGAGAAIRSGAGTALESIFPAIARNRAAIGERQRFLQRDIDSLADPRFSGVTDSGQSQHRRHAAGHLVGEMAWRSALPFGVVALAEKKSAGGIGDGVTAFVMPVQSGPTEWR